MIKSTLILFIATHSANLVQNQANLKSILFTFFQDYERNMLFKAVIYDAWKRWEVMRRVLCFTSPSGFCPANLINLYPSCSRCAGLSVFFIFIFIKSTTHQHFLLFVYSIKWICIKIQFASKSSHDCNEWEGNRRSNIFGCLSYWFIWNSLQLYERTNLKPVQANKSLHFRSFIQMNVILAGW